MSRTVSSGENVVRNFIDVSLSKDVAKTECRRTRPAARAVSKLIVAAAIANWGDEKSKARTILPGRRLDTSPKRQRGRFVDPNAGGENIPIPSLALRANVSNKNALAAHSR